MCPKCMERFHKEVERRNLTPDIMEWDLFKMRYEMDCKHEDDEVPDLRIGDEDGWSI